MKPRAAVQALRQAGGPADLRALEASMRSDFKSTASLVNYAAAPIGAKKYDAGTLGH